MGSAGGAVGSGKCIGDRTKRELVVSGAGLTRKRQSAGQGMYRPAIVVRPEKASVSPARKPELMATLASRSISVAGLMARSGLTATGGAPMSYTTASGFGATMSGGGGAARAKW